MYVHNSIIYFCLCQVAIFVVGAAKMMTLRKLGYVERITNGQTTTIDKIPSMVQIVQRNSTGIGFICGGTLISELHVISAAHCFKDYNASDISIVANATYLKSYNEGAIRRYADAIYIHPKYDNVTHNYDIVVISLSEPLIFGKGVQKAEMCTRSWRGNEKILAAGWGHIVEVANKLQDQLRMVKLDTISHAACVEAYIHLTPQMACSIVTRKRDTCNGDSGGPAFYKGELCGVVSFGLGCGRNGLPGIFASIPKLRNFINKSIENLRIKNIVSSLM